MIQDGSSLERDGKSRERSSNQKMNGSRDPLRVEERKTESSKRGRKEDGISYERYKARLKRSSNKRRK